MSITQKKQTKRIQIDLASASQERLDQLKSDTEAASYAEVIKNALRLYESIISQYKSGKRLFLKNDKGEITEYEIFY